MMPGAAQCRVVTFCLIRAHATGWSMLPRDAPSKGVCPPTVHRQGSHRLAGATVSRLPAILSTGRRGGRRPLWNLYKPSASGFLHGRVPVQHFALRISCYLHGPGAGLFRSVPPRLLSGCWLIQPWSPMPNERRERRRVRRCGRTGAAFDRVASRTAGSAPACTTATSP